MISSLDHWAKVAVRGSAIAVILTGIAALSPAAAQSTSSSHVPQAPVGHRQPTAANVPDNVLQDEDKMAPPGETGLDKKLNICRGC
jgi:hypothetical protein